MKCTGIEGDDILNLGRVTRVTPELARSSPSTRPVLPQPIYRRGPSYTLTSLESQRSEEEEGIGPKFGDRAGVGNLGEEPIREPVSGIGYKESKEPQLDAFANSPRVAL
ncbi:hypothetical protein TNCV_3077761 [Trichonephila clavipes]|nr:hypothetical protein TNCV_3077761 [Trichonephila clavipes]